MFGGLKKTPYICTTSTEIWVQTYKNVSNKPKIIKRKYD